MRLGLRLGVAAATTLATLGAGVAVDAGADTAEALGPGTVTIVLDVEHSALRPSSLRVVQGTAVRFVVVNNDPINHELIVGPPKVHERHRDGTEREHPPVPGEVTVPALTRGVTTYAFDAPGRVEMACHLPGHYEYGMRGTVEVLPTP